MTRDEAIAKARELREQGVSYSAIGSRLGVSSATIQRWLKPDFAERSRDMALAWKKRHAGTCQQCGGPTNGANGIGTAAKVCASCLQWTRDEIIEAFQAFYAERSRSPRVGDSYTDEFLPSDKPVIRHFGSWNGGLLAAGLLLNKDRRPETQQAIEAALRAGERTADIAVRFGVTEAAIRERMRVRGTTITEFRRQAA